MGLALNGFGDSANSQCAVTGAGSSANGSGNTLTLTLNLSFSANLAGNKVTYMAARDAAANNSGWQGLGVWQVPGATQTTTTAVGNMCCANSGTAGTLTFNFSDTKGFQDLGVVNILVNDSLDGRHACYLAYARSINVMYLVNDAGDSLLLGKSLSASGTLSNSQCTVSWGANPTFTGGGNLALTLSMAFNPSFSGNRVFYAAARDVSEANNTGWQAIGTWAVQ